MQAGLELAQRALRDLKTGANGADTGGINFEGRYRAT